MWEAVLIAGAFLYLFYIYRFESIHPYQDGNGRVDWLMYNIDMIVCFNAYDTRSCMKMNGAKLVMPQRYNFPANQLPKNIHFDFIEAFVNRNHHSHFLRNVS